MRPWASLALLVILSLLPATQPYADDYAPRGHVLLEQRQLPVVAGVRG